MFYFPLSLSFIMALADRMAMDMAPLWKAYVIISTDS